MHGFILNMLGFGREFARSLDLAVNTSRNGVQKLARCNDTDAGPSRRKMLCVSGNQVMRSRSLRALQKNIVVGIGTGADPLGRLDPESAFTNGAERTFDFIATSLEARASNYFFVLRVDVAADAEGVSGSSRIISKTRAGGPCELSRAEIRTLVSRTIRIIAPRVAGDYDAPRVQH